MNQSVSNQDSVEAIYQRALAKLESIAERHKQEIDAYIEELNQAKIKKLEHDLRS